MIKNLESLLKEQDKSSLIKCEWFSIKWIPDIASNERINIGVGVVNDNKIHVKLLDYFERIKCLYDEAAIFQAQFVCDIVKESVSANVVTVPCEQVEYEKRGLAQGISVRDLLDDLYEQTVTLSKKIRILQKESFNSIAVDKLYPDLVRELKIISGLDYENIVPDEPYINIHDNGIHPLYIPFRGNKNNIGSLTSAVYSDPSKVELNLLKAAQDVEVAIKLRQGNTGSVFILKPGSELSKLAKTQANSIESKLDRFDWYMIKQGIYVGSHIEIRGLAQEVYDWHRSVA